MISYRFIADVHLGRLARWLRLLGFDVLYTNDAAPALLIEITLAEDRILLSKWTGFTQHPSLQFLQIESSNSSEQLQQVIEHFHLKNSIQPFIRCLICNGHLQPVFKISVESQLLPIQKKHSIISGNVMPANISTGKVRTMKECSNW